MTPAVDDKKASGVTVLRFPSTRIRARLAGRLALALFAGGVALAGCGGGGDSNPTAVSGSEPAPDPSATAGQPYSLSGAVSVSESQTVDTDTNDPAQTGRRSNNTFGTVQPLPNPGLATGYLTVAGGGAAGAVSVAGDLVDAYTATLQAGQVIELDFTADTALVDVDLGLYDQDRNLVGRSVGTNSYECIAVTKAGTYTIGAQLFADGSTTGTLYQLRVGTPGSARCPNTQAQAATFVADSVVALAAPEPGSPVLPAAAASRKGLDVRSGGGDRSGAFMSLSVPTDEATMVRVLAANRSPHEPGGAAAVTAKAVEAARGDPAWRGGMSDQARSAHAAIDLAKSLVRHGQYLAATPNVLLYQQADPMPAFPPNDRLYPLQTWNYEMISLPAAATRLQGFTSTRADPPIVAVVDSGIVAEHPDLKGQVLTGYDFITDPLVAVDGDGPDANPDDSITSESWGFHGTHVAGTVAALTGNGIGVAGLAPIARIMPLRALGQPKSAGEGAGSTSDVIAGILYAAGLENSSGKLPARKADVINLSLGGRGDCPAIFQTAFSRVKDSGVMVVVAAGNGSDMAVPVDTPIAVPANCTNVIAVTAVGAQRTRAWYSNAGPEAAIAAPGGNLRESYTGMPGGDAVVSTIAVNGSGGRSPDYKGYQGTSMAAPHVAAVLALMRYVNPAITPAQVDALVRSGALTDDIGPAGWDRVFGNGLINADKAVVAALASRDGGGTAPPDTGAQVSAQPSSLFLGSNGQSGEITLAVTGTSSERITSVTTDSTVIAVAPKAGAVDATTALGTYVVTVNRAAVPDNTTVYPNVVVQLTPDRQIRIPVGVERRSGAASVGSAAGPVYVLVVDANSADNTVVAQVAVPSADAAGAYPYSVTVPGTARIWVVAGSDLDNDGFICNKGENCGIYPYMGRTPTVLQPSDTLTGISFAVSPLGGTNTGTESASVTGIAAAPTGASSVNSPFKQVFSRRP